MPLNTQPLSPIRQALMLATLLVCFMGSLAFADWIVASRRSRVSFSAYFPPDFPTAEVNLKLPGLCAARTGTVEGEKRELLYFLYPYVPVSDPDAHLLEAARLFTDVVGQVPEYKDVAMFGGQPAIDLRAVALPNHRFAFFRFTVVADRAVAVLYTGATPPTDNDVRQFEIIGLKVRLRNLTAAPGSSPNRGR